MWGGGSVEQRGKNWAVCGFGAAVGPATEGLAVCQRHYQRHLPLDAQQASQTQPQMHLEGLKGHRLWASCASALCMRCMQPQVSGPPAGLHVSVGLSLCLCVFLCLVRLCLCVRLSLLTAVSECLCRLLRANQKPNCSSKAQGFASVTTRLPAVATACSVASCSQIVCACDSFFSPKVKAPQTWAAERPQAAPVGSQCSSHLGVEVTEGRKPAVLLLAAASRPQASLDIYTKLCGSRRGLTCSQTEHMQQSSGHTDSRNSFAGAWRRNPAENLP